MEKSELSISQRLAAVTIYIALFLSLCWHFSGGWDFLVNAEDKYNILFVSGALLLIFGVYIAEPYFTKPIDVLTNSSAIILALLGVYNEEQFVGYWYVLYAAAFLGALSILVVVTAQMTSYERPKKILMEVVTKVGQSRIAFSVIYVLSLVSYLREEPIAFIFFLTFWLVFLSKYLVEGTLKWIWNLMNYFLSAKEFENVLGEAIGCDNPFLYKVEIDYFKHSAKEVEKGQLVL